MQRFSHAAAMVSRRDDADGLSARASPASWHDKRMGEAPHAIEHCSRRASAESGKARGKAVKLLFAQGTGIAEALGATAEARKVSFRLQLRA